jgi:hypothetical protein
MRWMNPFDDPLEVRLMIRWKSRKSVFALIARTCGWFRATMRCRRYGTRRFVRFAGLSSMLRGRWNEG